MFGCSAGNEWYIKSLHKVLSGIRLHQTVQFSELFGQFFPVGETSGDTSDKIEIYIYFITAL